MLTGNGPWDSGSHLVKWPDMYLDFKIQVKYKIKFDTGQMPTDTIPIINIVLAGNNRQVPLFDPTCLFDLENLENSSPFI